MQRVRQAIGARIAAALPGETGAIATALITGERGGISEATNDVFRDSGILHILSISGFHMAIMAGSVFFLVRLGLALFPSIALRYPIKKWAAAAAILAGFAYLMISGAAFATVRSAIMISIMFLAVLLDRPALALRNVILAATLILVRLPRKPVRRRLPDVVRRRAGARLGLRGAAHPRSVGEPDGARGLARSSCSSPASCCRR